MAPQTKAALSARSSQVARVLDDDTFGGAWSDSESESSEDYDYGTGIWNDDVTQADGQGEQLMFEKRYDAHYSAAGKHFTPNMRNTLGGTCEIGQLLSEGYDQQLENGNILKNAYVRDDTEELNQDMDPDQVLWDFDQDADNSYVDRAYEGKNMYFRSDDYQRTLVSGQVLLQTLFDSLIKRHGAHAWKTLDEDGNEVQTDTNKPTFNPVIKVHTNDRDTDTLSPNHKICPRLDELEEEAMSTTEYVTKFVTSDESVALKKKIEDLGGANRMEESDAAIDCLMTSMCTDRTLPDALDDYNSLSKDTNSVFKQVADAALSKKTFVYDYNKAAYAKLAMTPLWSDILSNILTHTQIPIEKLQETWPDIRQSPPKFALFSAHDTTIMGLLSSLDLESDLNKWPAYASMFLIELYSLETTYLPRDMLQTVKDTFPTKMAFRMIYNGEVVTQLMPRCEAELCDVYNLIDHLSVYADISQWGDDCQKTKRPASTPPAIVKQKKEPHKFSILAVIGFCLLCTFIGVMITYIKMETYWRGEQARNNDIILGPEEADACGSARVYGVVPSRASLD